MKQVIARGIALLEVAALLPLVLALLFFGTGLAQHFHVSAQLQTALDDSLREIVDQPLISDGTSENMQLTASPQRFSSKLLAGAQQLQQVLEHDLNLKPDSISIVLCAWQ